MSWFNFGFPRQSRSGAIRKADFRPKLEQLETRVAPALPVGSIDTWIGKLSNAWGTADNWSAGIPGLFNNVVIPPSKNAPVQAATDKIGVLSITIQPGGELTLLNAAAGSILVQETVVGAIIVGQLNVNGLLQTALLTNQSLVNVNKGGSIVAALGIINNGEFLFNATATVTGNFTNAAAGQLIYFASATVAGNLVNNGDIKPRLSDSALTVTKNFTQNGTGRILVDVIPGPPIKLNQITIQGTAMFDGQFLVFAGIKLPALPEDQVFLAITYGALGNFPGPNGAPMNSAFAATTAVIGGQVFLPRYRPTAFYLATLKGMKKLPPLPGAGGAGLARSIRLLQSFPTLLPPPLANLSRLQVR